MEDILNSPIKNPKTPNHATPRWNTGLSRIVPILPNFDRKDRRVKRITNTKLNAREMAMKAGVAAVGAERSSLGAD